MMWTSPCWNFSHCHVLLSLQVVPAIKELMQQKGDAMIGFQPLGSAPNFFRIVFAGAKLLQDCDLDALLQRIDTYGQQLFPAQQ